MAAPELRTVNELWRECNKEYVPLCKRSDPKELKGAFLIGVGACLHLFLDQDSDDGLGDDMADKLQALVKGIQSEIEAFHTEQREAKSDGRFD